MIGIGLLLPGCGESLDSSVSPNPPLITNLIFPDRVASGSPYPVTLSYVVPDGIPETPAVQLAWSLGGGLPLVVESLTAAAIGCVSGQTTCSTTFNVSQPPPLLSSQNSYTVTVSVFDRLGQSVSLPQSVFLEN
jgi:hypothetical protein